MPEGSQEYYDEERARLYVLEPDQTVRSFSSRVEFAVPAEVADDIRQQHFGFVALAAETVQPVTPAAAPLAAPYEILSKPEYFRKHHLRVLFFGSYERAIPSGSRFKITPRGVAVVTPLNRVGLYGPQGRVPLTVGEEALLKASVPQRIRSL
ncbi:hypothetical protein [Rathayibacter sp. VKM Ac-2857]|uniref:hypothetical protein n=1 Tax=Rathayibacter sp. VKM Ac-2857 TaxID=2739020 RepID=UPI001566D5DA|nr:hypothetical protein [Rathayibacter sp. VKM Ac-2857]NQX15082.1 hypothetical protein [Rathayibacter sp. VKM Ac-2857]